MRRIATTALLLAVALAAAGCGGGDGSASETTATGGPGGGGAGETVRIAETEFALDPASPKVAAAGTVTLHVVNDGSFAHALEIEGNGVEEETDELGAGDSADLTVDLKPGTYELYCPIGDHRQRGMEGTLVVAGGGTGGTTTTDDSGDGSDDDSGGSGSSGYGYG